MVIELLRTEKDFKFFIKENMQHEESWYDEIPVKYPCVICFISISICGQKWDDEFYGFIYPDIFKIVPEMKEKNYNELQENDIWTTDGIQIQFHAMQGKEGIPIQDISPEDANIFVPGNSIPDSFFD